MSAQSADSTSSNSSSERSRLVFVLAVVTVAQSPLLVLHFSYLWNLEHYQYFPIVIGAIAILIRTRWIASPRTCLQPVGSIYNRLFFFSATASLFLLAIAVIYYSPWLAAIAAVFTAGAALVKLQQFRQIRNVVGVWFLHWLLIPLPFRYDQDAILFLQKVSTKFSSLILDLAGHAHTTEGNILSVPGRDFFIDEACSGIMSLMTMVAASAVVAVWRNRPVLHCVLLITSAIFWAVFMNILRILLIAHFHLQLKIDLSAGWQHELTGLLLFSLGSLAVLSTDNILQFLLAPVRNQQLWGELKTPRNPATRAWNLLVVAGDPAERGKAVTVESSAKSSPESDAARAPVTLPGWAYVHAAAFVLLGVLQLGVIAQIKNQALGLERPPGYADAKSVLTRDSLLPVNSNWKLVGFEHETT